MFVAGIAVLLFASIPTQQLNAQILGAFSAVQTQSGPYVELTDDIEITSDKFGFPPNYANDLNDGYAVVMLDQFQFEFNGEVYDKFWVNINGFITFGKKENGLLMGPPNLTEGTREPRGLFWAAGSYPVNVIAPFWGDHYYRVADARFKGYAPTKISYQSEADKMIIQWKNLNVNYLPDYKASVADFQVILYKSTDPFSKQGNIEFRYGQIGKRPNQEEYVDIVDERVITAGASVGVKGEGTTTDAQAEFINCLYNGGPLRDEWNDIDPFTSEILTSDWTPSGSGALAIFVGAQTRFNIEEWWGDGDVDFSKSYGKAHYGMNQNRFVTINDARLIMKSIATNTPLDPVRRRAAYHADVNHNGRYYFDANGVKKLVPWRDLDYSENLPTEVSSIKQIRFEANEYDAALIVAYLGAKVPELPWTIDYVVEYGKKAEDTKLGFNFGTPELLPTGSYRMPVSVNQDFNGAIGAKFDINANVISAVSNVEDNMLVSNGTSNVVIAGSGEFTADQVIAYVTFNTENKEINVNNIRINDNNVENASLKFANVETSENNGIMLQNVPNPFTALTNITLNLVESGFYSLSVYDVRGNLVKTIAASEMNAGEATFEWNGTDNSGNSVESGVYVYRLTGNGNTIVKKMVLNK